MVNRIQILGINIDPLTMAETVEKVDRIIIEKNIVYVII